MPKFYTSINLNNNQLQNVSLNPQGTTPSTYAAGLIYFDTNSANTGTYNRLKIRNAANSAWLDIPYSGSIVNADISSSAAIAVSKLDTTSGSGGVRLDTVGTPTAAVSLNSKNITNLADPRSNQPQDAATKAYVDAAVSGLNVHAPVIAATTAALASTFTSATYNAGSAGGDGGTGVGAYFAITFSGSFAIDTQAINYGNRILVKNQGGANGTTNANNGIYVASSTSSEFTGSGAVGTTSPVYLIRDTDYDGSIAGEVAAGDYILIVNGAQKGQAFTLTSPTTAVSVGTSVLGFTQFSSATSYTASNGVKLTSGTNIELDNTTVPAGISTGTGNFVLSSSPTLTAPTIGAATASSVNKVTITPPSSTAILTLANNSTLITSGAYSTTLTATGTTSITLPTSGTLATVPTGTNQSLPTKYVTTFTASSGNVTKVISQATHGLSSNRNLIVQVSDSSGNVVYTDIVISAAGQVTITFADVSTSYDTYDITIIG